MTSLCSLQKPTKKKQWESAFSSFLRLPSCRFLRAVRRCAPAEARLLKLAGCNRLQRNVAERSYPSHKVRGSDREELPRFQGQGRWPRGATQRRRSGEAPRGATPRRRSREAADRSYHTPEVGGGGREELPHVQGAVAVWVHDGGEELLYVQGQMGGSEEIPLIQGKGQRLRFAGAAMNRYPEPKERETQVRW